MTSFSVRNQTYPSATLAAVNDALVVQPGDANLVTFVPTAVNAPSGIVLTFEGRVSNTDPWVVLSAIPTNSTAYATRLAASAAIAALPTFGWAVATMGFPQVRARCSARTGGTVSIKAVLSDLPL
jgi:ABC-type sugar transport system substrate-binding protein